MFGVEFVYGCCGGLCIGGGHYDLILDDSIVGHVYVVGGCCLGQRYVVGCHVGGLQCCVVGLIGWCHVGGFK